MGNFCCKKWKTTGKGNCRAKGTEGNMTNREILKCIDDGADRYAGSFGNAWHIRKKATDRKRNILIFSRNVLE